jgi:hypothetical protein
MNPHTRYEVCLDKTPAWFALAAILLAASCILGVIYLSVTAPEPVIPSSAFRLPKVPTVPDVHAKVQRGVDQALSGKSAVSR